MFGANKIPETSTWQISLAWLVLKIDFATKTKNYHKAKKFAKLDIGIQGFYVDYNVLFWHIWYVSSDPKKIW